MRQVRQLEPVATVGQKPTQSWGPVRGALFAAGVLIAVVSIATLIALKVAHRGIDTKKPEVDLEANAADVQSRTDDELWAAWWELTELDRRPLSRQTPQYLHNRERASQLVRYMVLAGLAVLAGILLAAAAVNVPAPPKRRRRKPRRPG